MTDPRSHAARYLGPDDRRAWRILIEIAVVYAVVLSATTLALARATPLAIFLLPLLSAAQVRAFMVHHDLCHGSFFASARLNRLVAPWIGALASTSPSVWSREHERHHRDSNKLDRPQDGQTAPWTVATYLAAPAWQRLLYRCACSRLVLLGLLPVAYFFGFMRLRARLGENLAFGAFALLLALSGAWRAFLLAMLPAAAFGFLVFHAQHSFAAVRRWRSADWDPVRNALEGSSLLLLPRLGPLGGLLRWALYSVEYHHVHHLHPGIPGWRLRACHEEGGALFAAVPRVALGQAWRDLRFALYDEERGLVAFSELGASG